MYFDTNCNFRVIISFKFSSLNSFLSPSSSDFFLKHRIYKYCWNIIEVHRLGLTTHYALKSVAIKDINANIEETV